MAKEFKTYCDICRSFIPETPAHWSYQKGSINLDLTGMANCQVQYKYEDACHACAKKLYTVIAETIKRLKEGIVDLEFNKPNNPEGRE